MKTLKNRYRSKICYFLASASLSFFLPFAVMSQPNVTLDAPAAQPNYELVPRILIAQETGSNEIVIRDRDGNLVNTILPGTSGNNINLVAENFDLNAGDEIVINVDSELFFYDLNGKAGDYSLVGEQQGYIAAGDTDGDSLPELFVTVSKIDKESQVLIYDGETGESFRTLHIRALDKNAPLSIAVADVDDDKVVDLAIVGDLKGKEVAVYDVYGTKLGTFEVFADDKKTGKSNNTPSGRRLVRKKDKGTGDPKVDNDNGKDCTQGNSKQCDPKPEKTEEKPKTDPKPVIDEPKPKTDPEPVIDEPKPTTDPEPVIDAPESEIVPVQEPVVDELPLCELVNAEEQSASDSELADAETTTSEEPPLDCIPVDPAPKSDKPKKPKTDTGTKPGNDNSNSQNQSENEGTTVPESTENDGDQNPPKDEGSTPPGQDKPDKKEETDPTASDPDDENSPVEPPPPPPPITSEPIHNHPGVNVATGDVDGDRVPEIIVGAAKHGGKVKVYRLDGTFVAEFETGFTHGVEITAGCLDGDGIDEIIVGNADGRTVLILGLQGKKLHEINRFQGLAEGKIGSLAYGLAAIEIPPEPVIEVPPIQEPTEVLEEETEVIEPVETETSEIEEIITSVEPAMPTTVQVELPLGTPVCIMPTGGIITKTCNGNDQIIVDAIIAEGVKLSNVTIDGDVTNNGTLSNITVAPGATLTGGQLSGTIDNQGTITDVEFVGAQIIGGYLAGDIDIPISGDGLGVYKDVTILPETTITGGTPKGEITNQGTLIDAVIPAGTIIDGGIVQGHIENDGILQNVVLAEDTYITGGELAGTITGTDHNLVEHLNILAGSQLSNVIIGNDVSFSDATDTVIGSGVLFSHNDFIPVEANLTPAYVKPFGDTIAVDTSIKLLTHPQAPTLLSQINTVLTTQVGESQIVQNPENGELEIEQGELFYSILPISVAQAPTQQTAGLIFQNDMTMLLTTEAGREVFALPVIQGLDELLDELGKTSEDVTVLDAGTLQIGDQYYRADFFSQTVSDDAQLGLFDEGKDKRHVFEKNGKKRQQLLSPVVSLSPEGIEGGLSECEYAADNPPPPSSIYAPRIKGDKFARGQKKRLKHDEAEFNMDSENALESDTTICIKSLYPLELPAIPKNMVNVTKGPRGAFEFFPKGQQFKDDVQIKVPYHKGKLPAGMTEEKIEIFYYDDERREWLPLERDNLDTNGSAITANTAHFTVMIAAAVKGTEMFEPDDYTPTAEAETFQQKTDPGAGIQLCSIPEANQQGSVVVNCPLEVTKGRLALQPELTVQYNSAASNGWMGMGWTIPVSTIEVETRWGAPRYHASKETETYALNGEMLTPIVHRGPLESRSGSEKEFHTRIEGEFKKIIRHGSNPKNYYWEVRDKDGKASYYGGDPSSSGSVVDATLTDAKGNIFKWALRKVQDTNGNTITYQHQRVAHNATPRGYDLYLTRINYSGYGSEAGPYQITFTRDSSRPDVISNARGGFMRVTADRLQRIDITYNNQPVRSYQFGYETGAFHKTLLASITQLGADGSQFHQHTFKYYDDARTNGQYNGFTAVQEWNAGEDNLTAGLLGEGAATAFGGTTTESEGGALYLGLNDTYRDKTQSLGARYGYSITKSEGLVTFEDINGDSLPDKIFKTDEGVYYRPNQSGPDGTTVFGDAQLLQGLPQISIESSRLFSVGPEIYVDSANTLNNNNSFTKTESYFSDVNGDGLVDFIDNGQVLFNVLTEDGHPTFTPNDSSNTPSPILDDDSNTTDISNLMENYGAEYQRQIDIFLLIDAMRRWQVPYTGEIQITGAVQLQQPASEELANYEGEPDGVKVAIQHNNTELWTTEIGPTDYTPKNPSEVDTISVTAGDMIYFRVQSRDDGAFDQVEWIPDIRYNNKPATLDVNGLDIYHYNAEDDFFLTGYAGMYVSMPIAGIVKVSGKLQKLATLTDDITLKLYKNDDIVFEQTLEASQTGTIILNQQIPVMPQDHITAHVHIDSEVDLTQLVWLEDNPLTLAYMSATDTSIPLTDNDGKLLIKTPMFCSYDVYPVVDTTVEPTPWKVPKSDNFVIAPLLAGLEIDPEIEGTITLTFKKQGELVKKHTITVSNGMINNGILTLPGRLKDEEIYVELSTTEPGLVEQLSQIDAAATDTDGIIASMPMVFRSPNPYQVIAQPYRGWTIFGYNGNRERANGPITITEADLTANDFKAAVEELETAYEDDTLDEQIVEAYHVEEQNSENSCNVVADGQVACYLFDGNANDGSSNGLNGTVNGATLTTDRFGNPNSAYQFNDSDFIQVADSSSLNFGTGNLSMALWVNTNVEGPIPPDPCCIPFVDKREGENTNGFSFYYRGTDIGFQLRNNGPYTNYKTTNSNVVTGNWKFVSVTIDRDQVNGGKLYIDGILAHTFDPTDKSGTLDNLSDLVIGKLFEGMLDDIRIYNRTLDQAEITTLYTLDSGYQEQPVTGCDKVPLGQVACYSFDGNANDESGNGLNGTVSGATLTADRLGNANSAYEFNGTSDYISIADDSAIDFERTQDFSVAVWVKPDEIQPYIAYRNNDIVEKWMGNSEGYPYVIRYENQTSSTPGKVWVARFDGYIEGYENNSVIFSTATINDGQFHQIVFVKNGTTLQLYIDGVLDGETIDTTQGDTTNNSPVFLGRRGTDTDFANYLKGVIDDLVIYNRALSQAEINELYGDSTGGLVAHYSFEGNAEDSSGNENHGVANGGVTYATGVSGQAAQFDGIDDYIAINPQSDVSQVGDFTVSSWVFVPEGSTKVGRGYIFDGYSHSNTATSDFFADGAATFYDYHTQMFGYGMYSDSGWIGQTVSYDLNGSWHHIVFFRQGEQLSTYIDGQFLDSKTANNQTLDMAHNWFIGTFSGNNPNYNGGVSNYSFDGLIDELRIYDHALSESQITDLYDQHADSQTTGGTGGTGGGTGSSSYLAQGMDGVAKNIQLNVIPFYPEIDNKRWIGTDNNTWATATQMSSSRWGMDHIEIPKADSLNGTRAVPRISQNQAKAHSADGSGASAGSASVGVLDFMDFNGDGQPDAAGHNGIQFTQMTGGLETNRQQSNLPGLREAQASANNPVSGNPPQIMASGSGYIRSLGSEMPPIGVIGDTSDGNAGMTTDLQDLNGDGLPDKLIYQANGQLWVAFNLGYQFGSPEPWGTAEIKTQSSGESLPGAVGFNTGDYSFVAGESLSRNASVTNSLLADINGDGLLDHLHVDDQLNVALNTGNGFTADIPWGDAINQGLAKNTNTAHGQGKFFSIGIGPLQCGDPLNPEECYVILNPGNHKGKSIDRPEVKIADIDGDGYADYLHSEQDSSIKVQANPIGRTNLLQRVERPLGAKITVDYQRVGNTYRQPHSHWVMSRVEIDDGHHTNDGVDVQLTTFRYQDGYFNRQEREFYGYQTVIEEQRDSTQGDALYRRITREYYNDSYYRKGLMYKETTTDAQQRKFVESEPAYVLQDIDANTIVTDLNHLTATVFPQLVRQDRRFYEGQATAGKSTYIEYGYDQYGNINYALDAADAGTLDDLTFELTYFKDFPNYIVGKANKIVIRGGGIEMRHREANFATGTGNMMQLREYLETGQAAITDYQYDQYGNSIVATGPSNHKGQRYTLRYTYDNQVHTNITQRRDSFGYSSSADYDLRFGTITQTRDANNNPMTYSYDTHGRLATMRGPYEIDKGLTYAMRFDYHPNDVVPWALTQYMDDYRNANDPIETVHFVDGLKRTVQFKKDVADHGQDVMQVSNRVKFDLVGRVIEKYYPVTESIGNQGVFNASFDGVTPTVMTYDVLDRVTSETNPAGERHRKVYGFGTDRDGKQQFQISEIDANGIPSDTFYDVRNLQTAVLQFNNGGAEVIWTSFKFDPMKQIIQVKDDQNNIMTAEYDNLGRRTVIDNPDTGREERVYDLAGNLIKKITGNLRNANLSELAKTLTKVTAVDIAHEKAIVYEYDFNRLKKRSYPIFPGNDVFYEYGDPGDPENRANRILSIKDESGVEERFYGKLGEITKTIKTIASDTQGNSANSVENYTMLYEYDTWNRIRNVIYPDGTLNANGEIVTYAYDSGGLLKSIAGEKDGISYPYLNRMEYDKFEDRIFTEFGNNVQTTVQYHPAHRRLMRMTTQGPNQLFQQISYDYDNVGNMLGQANAAAVTSSSQKGGATDFSYQYDDLYRLVGSHGQFAPVNKIHSYQLNMQYDTIHNIQHKTQTHSIGEPSGQQVSQQKTSYDWSYGYGGQQPHAPTQIGNRTYRYDANGNQLSWTHGQNTQRNTIWDEENRIQLMRTGGHAITYKYNHEGKRVIKDGPQGETVYVSPYYTIRNGSTGTKHIYANKTRIVTKMAKKEAQKNAKDSTPEEKERYFYHRDHLGSGAYITDTDGEIYQHLEYFSFGEIFVEEVSNIQRTPYWFTAKELDEETGLYYVEARYFDPRASIWLSVDPIMDSYLDGYPNKGVFEPTNLGVYTYVGNNPIMFVDPTGLSRILFGR